MAARNDISIVDYGRAVSASSLAVTNLPAVPLLGITHVSITVVAGLGADGTALIQYTDFDAANSFGGPTQANTWVNGPNVAVTSSGVVNLQVANVGAKYMRVRFTAGGASVGTVDIALTGKAESR